MRAPNRLCVVPLNSIVVANRFIELAAEKGQKLTNMQLQKLVFLANGLFLAKTSFPLTFHNVHAWKWGPVFPQLYKRFSAYGASQIVAPAACEEAAVEVGSKEDAMIRLVWEKFGGFSGAKLSAITHQPDSPWEVTWKAEQYGVISSDLIRDFYQKQLNAPPG